jgi:hypothetical protein
MESNWATEHLQAIRTLMERAAIYRRALAPVMLLAGVVGLVAAVGGWYFQIDSPRAFVGYWIGVSLIPLAGAVFLVRRQALQHGERFWSPPMRRVTLALLPPVVAGFSGSVILLIHLRGLDASTADVLGLLWLPLGWIVLYGCALHAAGFFMPRGMKLFGWLFVLGGCGLFALGIPDLPRATYIHGVMGLFFGALHLAYGVYLYFTEKNET